MNPFNCETIYFVRFIFEVAALKGILKKFVFSAGKEKDPRVFLSNRKDKVVKNSEKEVSNGSYLCRSALKKKTRLQSLCLEGTVR